MELEIFVRFPSPRLIEGRVASVNGLFSLIQRLETVKKIVLLSEALSCQVVTIIFVDKLLQRNNILVPDVNLSVPSSIFASFVRRVDRHGVAIVLRIVLVDLWDTRPVGSLLADTDLVALKE